MTKLKFVDHSNSEQERLMLVTTDVENVSGVRPELNLKGSIRFFKI